MKNKELKRAALASLEGNWSKYALLSLVYALIIFAVVIIISLAGIWLSGGNIGDNTLFNDDKASVPTNNIVSIISNLILWPFIWSYTIIFLRHLRHRSDTETSNLFDGYKQYLRITLTLLLQGIYTFLWTLLLVIPGIIKHYSYSMTSYVLHDNPELKYDDAIDRSIKLMKGHKMKLFLLDLSFIGWILLGIITCGIGMLWVYPYWLTSHAAFYNDLLEEEAAKTAEREPFVTGVEIVAPETPSAENN